MFGYFKRNTQILGLIRLEFEVWEGNFAVMSQRIVRMAPADKPKLLDQVRGVIRRNEVSRLGDLRDEHHKARLESALGLGCGFRRANNQSGLLTHTATTEGVS